MNLRLYPIVVLIFSACIGIDTVDDRTPFTVSITLDNNSLGRTVEQPIELGLNTNKKLFRITNLQNQEINEQFIWKVEPADIMTADGGVVVAKKAGLAKLTIWENSTKSLPENHTWYIKIVQFERLEVKSGSGLNAVLLDSTLQLQATYYNSDNQTQSTAIAWESKNTAIATVDANGLLKAIKLGQVEIQAKVSGKDVTTMLLITVTDKKDALASLEIVSSTQSLKVGQTLQLKAVAKNVVGETITPTALVWKSDKTNIATVGNTGLVSAIAAGKASITVSEGDVKSMPVSITVLAGVKERLGSFKSGRGSTAGTVTLFVDSNDNKLKVRLNNDFVGAGIPGPTLYLSNNGSSVDNTALEIQTIQPGAGNNRVFTIPGNPDISTYKYLIYHCKPFNIIYGTFQFN